MKKMIPKEEAEYYLNLYYVDDYDEDGSLGEGEVVETEDLIFGQAYNGHISAYDKHTGAMCFHMSCKRMYSKEELQEMADDCQSRYGLPPVTVPTEMS